MTFDWLTTPISDDAPCGPDLESADDGPFLDYYYEAESRIPERYFTPSMQDMGEGISAGTVFDKRAIDIKSETAAITKLLERTRDLRLLTLWARFAILAGKLTDFAQILTATGAVMETFGNDVNPKATADRRGALDVLGDNVSICVPLQYAELAGPGEVSLRRYQVASGAASPRVGEDGVSVSGMTGELAAPGNKKFVEEAHRDLLAIAAAYDQIKSACLRSDTPFTPPLDPAIKVVKDALALIAMGRPDLSADAEAPEAQETPEPEVTAADKPPAPDAAAPTVVTKLPNRAAAFVTLQAIEGYFATHEPASPALLLVTQARLLFGKPLVEALETLLPSQSANAIISFGADSGFALDMNQLRMLAGEATSVAQDTSADDPGPAPVVTNRADVSGHLSALEEFYRAREPASPVPVLLFRARTYLEKDFSAIVTEIIPAKVDE